ncbi:MAG: alpha/beta hydrolase [Dermatophilus congolensis]|nr:alpha/beta hydrolase [Dermatophilus congolensis]
MSEREKRIAVPGGHLAVVDHGGDGHDVLLVHSVCHSSAVWEPVAQVLATDAHVVALDMRGHGQSTAETTEIAQIPADIAHVIETLGLDRPVLVGHDVAGGFVTAVAAARPDLVGGVVVIDSPVVEPQEAVREMVRTVGAETIVAMLTERFELGATGPDQASAQAFIDRHASANIDDWLSPSRDAAAGRKFLERALLFSEDGSWVYRPTPQAVRALTADPDESTFQPGLELLAQVDAPVTVVTVARGRNGSGGEALEAVAATKPNMRITWIDTDSYVLDAEPQAVARDIRETITAIEQA